MTSQPLPAPCEGQPYFDVSVLEAGLIDLKDEMFITNAEPGKVTRAPSLSFLLTHSLTGKKVVFDLGIRKDWENYPPVIVKWIKEVYPVDVKQDVVESLSKGGISPDDVDFVCLSHLHWDHSGDTQLFKHSTFIVGGRCQALLEPSKAYPHDPEGRFPHHLLPPGRTLFLDPASGHSIGPFPHALNFFNDGSLYLVDAPGHLPGHMNALVRTSEDGAWIYLAGDSAHHWKLITLEAQVAVGHPGHLSICAHDDKEAAEEHILRINKLWKTPRVRVMLAHDEPWYVENKGGDAFWPGKLPSL
jgi:glyoxylase-like metal-dependent hydrolase (beta-lactamase superfamily II)